MGATAIVFRQALGAIALFGLGALVGCTSPRMPHFGKSAAAAQAPRQVRVISSTTPPTIRNAGWQPTQRQSTLTGALAGGGAGAGIGAGVCTAVLICPVCYPGCVALWGLGGLAVGAVGGEVAHAQLAFDPANRMLPASEELSPLLRSHVVARLSQDQRFKIEDGGAEAINFTATEVGLADSTDSAAATSTLRPAWVLEVGLSDIRAIAMRKGGFEVQMNALARRRRGDGGGRSVVERFSYSSKRIKAGGSLDAESARIQTEVEHGMDEIADEMMSRLLEDD